MKQKHLGVSIVIPAYNEERQLKACLEAVAAQTQAPFEVIVVDNNSTDSTVKIAESFPFVRVVHEERQGSVFASAKGMDVAKGEIIGRLDSDTLLAPDWVATVSQFFATRTDIAAVTGKCYFRDFPFKQTLSLAHAVTYHHLQKPITGGEVLWGSNMAIRGNVWHAVRDNCNMQKGIDEDIDLSIQLAKQRFTAKRLPKAVATVSLRRGDIGPRAIARYLSSWHRNYTVNQQYCRATLVYGLKTGVFLMILPVSVLYLLLRRL